VTAVLDRLEKAGFIQRVADSEDRRKVYLRTVPERFAGAGDLFGDFLAANGQILARYSDDQLRTILDYVTATTDVYHEQAMKLREKAAKQGKKK